MNWRYIHIGLSRSHEVIDDSIHRISLQRVVKIYWSNFQFSLRVKWIRVTGGTGTRRRNFNPVNWNTGYAAVGQKPFSLQIVTTIWTNQFVQNVLMSDKLLNHDQNMTFIVVLWIIIVLWLRRRNSNHAKNLYFAMVCVDEKRLVGEIVSVTTVLVARSTSTGSNVHSTVTGTTGRVLVLTIYNIIPCVIQKEYMKLTVNNSVISSPINRFITAFHLSTFSRRGSRRFTAHR